MSKIPTKFKVTQSCGHDQLLDLRKIFPDRPISELNQRFADFLSKKNQENAETEKARLCTDCFKLSRQRDDAQWLLDIEAFEQKYQLPEFTGTDNQLASESLVTNAMKSRHVVLSELFENPSDQAKENHGALLDAAREVTHISFWVNDEGLGYGARKERGYGQEEYIELLLAKHEAEKQRAANASTTDWIESENPHDWNGQE